MDALPVSPVVIGAAVLVALVVWGSRQYYQSCPHCSALVRRVYAGWRRCGRCGRQYRRGLRLR